MNACDHPWIMPGDYTFAMCKACGEPAVNCPRCAPNEDDEPDDGCTVCGGEGYVTVYFVDREGQRLQNDDVEILHGLNALCGEWRDTTAIGAGDGPSHDEALQRLIGRGLIEFDGESAYRITPAGVEFVESITTHPTDRSEDDGE